MATLNENDLKYSRKRKYRWIVLIIAIAVVASPIIAELLDKTLIGILQDFGNFKYNFSYSENLKNLVTQRNRQVLTASFYLLLMIWVILSNSFVKPVIVNTETREVAKGIVTPVPVGNGQYGTARFMTSTELDATFSTAISCGNGTADGLSCNAGIIVDFKKEGKKEYIRYLSDYTNTVVLGATRSGKTRRLLMTSIWLDILAGINMMVIDVKGELCAFTSPFAKANGYEVRTLDFRYPERSMHFNNLAEIVQLLKKNKISEAVDRAWDIVTILVGEQKGERIWTDGQCATIVAAILIVAQDAPEECKNLANVYYFLSYMCEADPETGDMPINDYIENLPYNHPARGAFQIAKIAPFRTRSSFFTSALATLRLYTGLHVADVSSKSDYSFDDSDDKKVIYYLILPDEKTTFHSIGAIYMLQLYESLVKQSLNKGGKLDRKFIIRAEEIGNFPVIPGLGTMLSAGAGRNIFFELVLQDFQQLEGKYKDDFRNIMTNCQLTICLKVTDDHTTKSISARLGNYTTQINSASSSQTDGNGRKDSASYSNSSNMTGRPLLYPDEISQLESPDTLILYGGKKAITNLPDISCYYANRDFGMGDEEFNKKLFLKRLAERPTREIGEPKLWGVWEEYGFDRINDDNEEKVTFL